MPRQRFHRHLAALALASLPFTACGGCDTAGSKAAARQPSAGRQTTASTRPSVPPEAKPLFERLGGTARVTKVVDDFVTLAAANPQVNFTRQGHPGAWDPTPQNVALLKKRLVEFVATASGGDATYTGKDLVTAHQGMNVTDAEFDAMALDLKAAMDKHDVPAPEQAELLAIVNRTRDAIVLDDTAAPSTKRPAAADTEPNPGDVPKVPGPAKPTADDDAPAAPVPPATADATRTSAPSPAPQPVTSEETELEPEPAKASPKKPALEELNK